MSNGDKAVWEMVEQIARLQKPGTALCPECGMDEWNEDGRGMRCQNCQEWQSFGQYDAYKYDNCQDAADSLGRLIEMAREIVRAGGAA